MHTLRYNLLVLTFLACFSITSAQRKPLTAGEAATFKEKISANMRSLQSLESDFTQTKQLSYVENVITSNGKLYFKSPYHIRWEYHHPSQYVVLFDQQTMSIEEGGRIKTVDLHTNRRAKGLNELLVGSVQEGNLFDEERFDITCYRENGNHTAILTPKEKALGRYIKQVELAFDGQTSLLTQVAIIDPAGDRTQIAFTNQRKNAPIADAKFIAVTSKK